MKPKKVNIELTSLSNYKGVECDQPKGWQLCPMNLIRLVSKTESQTKDLYKWTSLRVECFSMKKSFSSGSDMLRKNINPNKTTSVINNFGCKLLRE